MMRRWVCLVLLGACLVGCRSARPEPTVGVDVHAALLSEAGSLPSLSAVRQPGDGRLRIVATTSFVAEAVREIGGERIELHVLMPPGTDPHAFEATPRDAAAIAKAQALFANGFGLEISLEPLLTNLGRDVPIVPVSYGLDPLYLHDEDTGVSDSSAHAHEADGEIDPHTWFDPTNIMRWCDNIVWALGELDPSNAASYGERAQAYRNRLQELDSWVLVQMAQIAPERRLLVTDHLSFGYFARRYGFRQVGAILPGFSTLVQSSAQDIAALIEEIRELQVQALFVGREMNTDVASRIAEDTGTALVVLYTGSLSGEGGPAASYEQFMRYNVTQIVNALR